MWRKRCGERRLTSRLLDLELRLARTRVEVQEEVQEGDWVLLHGRLQEERRVEHLAARHDSRQRLCLLLARAGRTIPAFLWPGRQLQSRLEGTATVLAADTSQPAVASTPARRGPSCRPQGREEEEEEEKEGRREEEEHSSSSLLKEVKKG